jgi:hypothetical protein
MEINEVLQFLLSSFPKLEMVFVVLGLLVTIGTVVDQLLPKVSFMDKLFNIPFLGSVLKALTRFSPLNVKEDKKE